MSSKETTRRLLPEGIKVSHVAADSGALTIHAESADVCQGYGRAGFDLLRARVLAA